MGIEIVINSLEEMCDLMCNNTLPKQRKPNKDEEETEKQNRRTNENPPS